MCRTGQLVKKWWAQPDQFESITALLGQRELLRSTQRLLAVIAALAGLAPLVLLSTSARHTTAPVIASLFGSAYVALSTGFFMRRWPTRVQSAILSSGGAAVIAAWSLAQSDLTLQFLGCAVMVIPGGYLAVFHNTKMMLISFVSSAVIAIAAALHMGRHADMATSVASFCVLWLINVAVPLGARGLSRAMTSYATDSHHDSLTGLLNRRGLAHRFAAYVGAAPSAIATDVAVLLIDLDHFKAFNDTHGHPQGDQLLIAVAQLLSRACPAHAAICRCGGEEFLISYTTNAPGPPQLAAQLCRAIAGLPHGITASIGTTTTPLRTVNSRSALDMLIGTADTAMYLAKHSGGNQTQHQPTGNEISRREVAR